MTGPPAHRLSGVVGRAVRAANDGDQDGFVALFRDDGFVDDWGRVFRGHDAIGEWSQKEFIGVRVSLAVTDVNIRSSVTTLTATVGGQGFNGPSHFAFDVADDRLRSMRITG